VALDPVFERAEELARGYLGELGERPVGAGDADDLRRELSDAGEDAVKVLEELAADAEPGLVESTGPRYFGFVVGGALPVALAADWLVSTWDQTASFNISAPAAAALEETTAQWILDILGLPATAGLGFATGAQMANFTCLGAARGELLRREGWDAEADGLFGAPEIEVFVGEEVHVSALAALRYLGLGHSRLTRVGVDANGAMDPDALREALAGGGGPTLVCAQAGNVNTGACDPLGDICEVAAERDAWVHVDGAFGMWAAASPAVEHLVAGRERAHSWALDCHKWLNVPYDCALAIVADAEAQQRAMALAAAYLAETGTRQPTNFVPEASRRSRAVTVYAALRFLGRDGLAEMIDRNCAQARLMAELLAEGGMEILNDVVLNQVLVAGEPDHVERIQADGTCWLGGTTRRDQFALRISFSNWSTTEDDVRRSAEAILGLR
jgi:glutamate/tyrosine decarboxylase-like PLP-dependent enzyme